MFSLFDTFLTLGKLNLPERFTLDCCITDMYYIVYLLNLYPNFVRERATDTSITSNLCQIALLLVVPLEDPRTN